MSILMLIQSCIFVTIIQQEQEEVEITSQKSSTPNDISTYYEVKTLTLYEELSEEEIELIEKVVQLETGNMDFLYQKTVAGVIYNRYKSDRFPNDVKEIILAPNQFYGESILSKDVEISVFTENAVRQVFSNPDDEVYKIIKDAVFYCNFDYSSQDWSDKEKVGEYNGYYKANPDKIEKTKFYK